MKTSPSSMVALTTPVVLPILDLVNVLDVVFANDDTVDLIQAPSVKTNSVQVGFPRSAVTLDSTGYARGFKGLLNLAHYVNLTLKLIENEDA